MFAENYKINILGGKQWGKHGDGQTKSAFLFVMKRKSINKNHG